MLELNKIHNGDSYELIKQIPDKSIDLICTDPPYDIENTKAGGNSDFAKSIQGMNNELKENKLTESINPDILNDFIRVCKKPNIYIWCNKSQIPMYLNFFVEKHECSFDILIWKKTNAMPTFNNKYLTDKEYCLYFRKNAYCNPECYEDAKTVFELPINLKDKIEFEHTTIKPLKIIKTLIKNSSKPNDVILDTFLGSGTTAVAAKETGRQFVAIEKEKRWYDIAVDRINGITASGQYTMFGRVI